MTKNKSTKRSIGKNPMPAPAQPSKDKGSRVHRITAKLKQFLPKRKTFALGRPSEGRVKLVGWVLPTTLAKIQSAPGASLGRKIDLAVGL